MCTLIVPIGNISHRRSPLLQVHILLLGFESKIMNPLLEHFSVVFVFLLFFFFFFQLLLWLFFRLGVGSVL